MDTYKINELKDTHDLLKGSLGMLAITSGLCTASGLYYNSRDDSKDIVLHGWYGQESGLEILTTQQSVQEPELSNSTIYYQASVGFGTPQIALGLVAGLMTLHVGKMLFSVKNTLGILQRSQ